MGDKFLPNVISTTLDAIPVVGNIKGGFELLSGKDLITQSKLDNFDKALTVSSLFLSGGAKVAGKLAKNSAKGAKIFRKAETVAKGTKNICGTVSGVKRFNNFDPQ